MKGLNDATMESQQQKTLFVLGTLFVVTCIGLGTGMYFAGYYAYHSPETQIDIADDLMNEISAEKISEYLKHLSSVPHLAGTAQDKEQAEWIKQNFLDFGLDDAVLVPYNVLLSYPNKTQANKVSLLNDTGILLETQAKQKPLYGEEEASDLIVSNFNAYSAPGIVQRDSLVYIYYGRTADFDFIQSQGIDITDKIVMARYGQEFSGTIAQTAEKRGAAGVLLFSDPQDFALEGRNQSYPDTFWMPGTATRFGFLYMDNGDPLTPFYPAIESAHRITINSGICPVSRCSVLPKIPVQVVSYNEAEVLLQAIGGMPSPSEWQGDLDADYNLGPNLKDNLQVKMEVYTTNQMATTYNTIGILRGEIEPDRYVLVGNHRDAWTLGAVDPSSGTAAMLEIARAFGKMKRDHGWKPRRTIVFCSWGAEEYGLIGSYEWVEQNSKVLSQRAVAYLNVDIAVQGNYTLRGTAAPLLHDVLVQSAKKVPTPDPSEVALGRNTFFDTWRNRSQDPSHPEFPRINILGVDSDFSGFMHVIGVPSVDLRHTHNEPVPSYPLYHTLYESYHLLADIIDQGFNYHRAMARLWAEVARTLTESHVLPFDIRWYAAFLQKVFVDIQTRYGTQLAANGASLDFFKAAVDKFDNDTKSFAEMLKNLDTNQNVLAVRRVNDQLMQLERHFIEPQGLPGHPEWNHIILAPTSSETYTSTGFPGLTDLLDLVGNDTEAQRPLEWAQIKQHIGVIAFRVQEAGNSLVHESIVC